MANFCLMIQYDGTRYNGLAAPGQHLKYNSGEAGNDTGTALRRACRSEWLRPHRCQAYMHCARSPISGFRCIMSRYSCQKIQDYFNQYLPQDIRVLAVEQVPERFHARLSASSKLYEYRIDCGEVANVFQRRYLLRVENKLNLEHMRKAADLLTGTHDFKSFCANRHMKKSTVRTIYEIAIEENDGILSIRYHGDGFLYNMVRILTGTLLEVGLGDRSLPEVRLALEGKDRSLAGFTAPPQGLFLVDVFIRRRKKSVHYNTYLSLR